MEGIKLYDFTPAQVIGFLTEDAAETYNISKKQAKALVLNALIYHCVSEEVIGQVGFLIEQGLLK